MFLKSDLVRRINQIRRSPVLQTVEPPDSISIYMNKLWGTIITCKLSGRSYIHIIIVPHHYRYYPGDRFPDESSVQGIKYPGDQLPWYQTSGNPPKHILAALTTQALNSDVPRLKFRRWYTIALIACLSLWALLRNCT